MVGGRPVLTEMRPSDNDYQACLSVGLVYLSVYFGACNMYLCGSSTNVGKGDTHRPTHHHQHTPHTTHRRPSSASPATRCRRSTRASAAPTSSPPATAAFSRWVHSTTTISTAALLCLLASHPSTLPPTQQHILTHNHNRTPTTHPKKNMTGDLHPRRLGHAHLTRSLRRDPPRHRRGRPRHHRHHRAAHAGTTLVCC